MRKVVFSLAACLALTFASPVFAQQNTSGTVPFQVHTETGAAIPLGNTLAGVYSPGPTMEVKALWSVHPNISIGPGVNAFFLPKTHAMHDTDGTSVWQFGPVVRFQGVRHAPDFGIPHFSPWIDVSAMLAANQNLPRPAINIGVGAEVPLDDHRIFWIGPMIKYSHMFMNDSPYHDLNILQAGFSFSFDLPVHVPVEKIRVPEVHVKREVKVVVKEIPVIKEVSPSIPLSFSEKVYFTVNSSALHWESKDKLDMVIQKLNSNKNVKIKVQGNSSSDGLLSFNIKLSQKRMQAVMDYLINHGVDPKRLVAENEGVSHPVAPNATKEGRERNRRVEFTVTFSSIE